MKTAERENPNRRPQCVANRADGAASQYRSCSIMWAAKQENFQPAEKCFFLTSPFIELTGCAVKGGGPQRELNPPGNWFAPPGSNRSSGGGNEAAEAFGVEGRIGDSASMQAVT